MACYASLECSHVQSNKLLISNVADLDVEDDFFDDDMSFMISVDRTPSIYSGPVPEAAILASDRAHRFMDPAYYAWIELLDSREKGTKPFLY